VEIRNCGNQSISDAFKNKKINKLNNKLNTNFNEINLRVKEMEPEKIIDLAKLI